MKITVEYSGKGFPYDFSITDSGTFGLYLENSLTEQNNGNMGFPEGEGADVMGIMKLS